MPCTLGDLLLIGLPLALLSLQPVGVPLFGSRQKNDKTQGDPISGLLLQGEMLACEKG